MRLRAALVLLLPPSVHACTTVIAGRLATVDGSVMCSHSNDGEGATDPRLVHMPAHDHAAGSMRPIFYSPERYPRYVGDARGAVPAYLPTEHQSPMVKIGEIPEVAHTYGYFEETYGAMNERQVGIGESTCSGVFGTSAAAHGGSALLSVDALSQLAMERANSSRAAVLLMGRLAEEYGFYGAGSFEGTAESLMVTDPYEGWIFHILPDPTGESAIWAAQRVPDTHIGVVPNVFVIREVDFDDAANFLGSSTVHSVALARGWWKPSDGLLDFTSIYSDGEYAHKYYSGRRAWGVYFLLAPSLDLPAEYGEWRSSRPYPVTAPPDKLVSLEDITGAMRSYYEGTPYDQTRGLAAGPWGNPDHGKFGSAGNAVEGNFERTIGLFRSSDSHVTQSRSWLPDAHGGVLWWGAHAAPTTIFVPLPIGMGGLPNCTLGHPAALDKGTLFWAARYLHNIVQLKHSKMYPMVQAMQAEAHAASIALQRQTDAAAAAASASAAAAAAAAAPAAGEPSGELYRLYAANAASSVARMWELTDTLMFRFADGFLTSVSPTGTLSVEPDPYPDWWLEAVGYRDGPPPVPAKGGGHPQPEPHSPEAPAGGGGTALAWLLGAAALVLVVVLVGRSERVWVWLRRWRSPPAAAAGLASSDATGTRFAEFRG